ncbi:MAG TPA: hypothetical protein VN414_11520 [Methanosarcina sp.]|nr:hypothetical protein [Methanosarcina sp.]
MFLHGEKLDAMAATDVQKALVTLTEHYQDRKELLNDINQLYRVKINPANGKEFCGDVHKYQATHIPTTIRFKPNNETCNISLYTGSFLENCLLTLKLVRPASANIRRQDSTLDARLVV